MPPFLTYQNFDLEIETYAAGYRAHVISSPVGQVDWTVFSLPFSPQQTQAARQLFAGVRHLRPNSGDTPPLDPKGFGRQLYEAVFAGEIGRCLSRSLEKIDDTTGLRIRLRLNNAPDLADLPWEMLHGPSPFDFFALWARAPIVRYLATSLAEAVVTATLPLHILVVIANPSTPDAPALDVEAEWGKLNTALAALQEKRQVVLERLASPTLAALRARLRTNDDKPAIHLLHFIGHGETGTLVFENEQGAPTPVTAERLAVLLHDHPTLKLAFLNACEGGRSDDRDIFLGVAPELVRRGLPTVIAMQYAVSDRAAIALAAEFYQALADGYPVDAALAEARKALYGGGQSVEWGTPLLFSRSADNRLLAPTVTPATSAPAPPITHIDTGGGVYMGGDAAVAGDFVERDKIIHGDEVHSDKIAGDKVAGDKITNIYVTATEPPIKPASPLLAAEIVRQSFEPETILIPAGPFWMGSDDAEYERPRHQVTLSTYRIGKYPITNTQYAEFLKRNPQIAQPDMKHWFQRQPKKGLGNFPIVNLNWQEALDFCRWLAQETGRAYSLPSEAQWEKAARSDDGRSYPWGNQWQIGCANLAGTQPSAVDTYPDGASPYRCLDLLGNVEEWTSTLWGADERTLDFPYPYQAGDGREAVTVSQFRIHRGGSYRSPQVTVRATTRSAIHQGSKVPWRGFRVVLNV